MVVFLGGEGGLTHLTVWVHVHLSLFLCMVSAGRPPQQWIKWAKFTGAENAEA